MSWWEELVGERVSMLISGMDGKQENYVGEVIGCRDEGNLTFISIKCYEVTVDEGIVTKNIIVEVSYIQSIWVYSNKKYEGKDKCRGEESQEHG